MSRQPSPGPPGAPTLTQAMIGQAESRRLLEAALSPWLVTRWVENDFGIDAVVEVTSELDGSADKRVTGTLFSVQLKSTHDPEPPTSIRVTTSTLRYWFNHSLPVLLVRAHLPTKALRGRWVDEHLLSELRVRNPSFWMQQTTSVALDSAFAVACEAKPAIEAAVLQFRRRTLVVSPKRFFELRDEVLRSARALGDVARETRVEQASTLASRVVESLKARAYAVAVTGPPRAGKSTLVNALLGVDVSPVADYPTTAIPISFAADDRPNARVRFHDGRVLAVEASASALRPYAAQQENDANDKGVAVVEVGLPNDLLARGVVLVDTPGLHDASPSVRDVTRLAVDGSDAILYVLDAGLGAKFRLGESEIADLKVLQQSKDRLLVVLNQADLLDEAGRERLLEYVCGQLRRYGIGPSLPTPPFFTSGHEAWEARRVGKDPPAAFQQLEDRLWGHLLRARATGLHRLQAAVRSLDEAASTIQDLLDDRRNNGLESARLSEVKAKCQDAATSAEQKYAAWRKACAAAVEAYLVERIDQAVTEFSRQLWSIPSAGRLPRGDEVEQLLRHLVRGAHGEIAGYMRSQADALAAEIEELVRAALADARLQLGMPATVTLAAPFMAGLPPVSFALPEEGLGILGGLFGFFAHPVVGILTTLVGWFLGRDVALKRRRTRVVGTYGREFRKSLTAAFRQLASDAGERLDATGSSLLMQARGRLDTFMSDTETMINRLGRPIDEAESARLQTLRVAVGPLRGELEKIAVEVTNASGLGSAFDLAGGKEADAGSPPPESSATKPRS